METALEEHSSVAYKRDAIIVRLLDECIVTLSGHGMQRLFLDAIKGGDEGFQRLSKKENPFRTAPRSLVPANISTNCRFPEMGELPRRMAEGSSLTELFSWAEIH